jgi:hypothetical protein
MTTFDKAKKRNNPRKKWWIVNIKGYRVYLWGVPFVPFILLRDWCADRKYENLVWSDEKATQMLDKILPKFLEWVEEDEAYYFCMEWGYSNYQYQVPIWHRAWVRKFGSKLREFVREGYENPKYIKEHENDGYDEWIKFIEKRG